MIQLKNINKSYKIGKSKIDILKNINIDFKKNELVFILGRSGSGKSTLLNIIGGLIKPTSGAILLDNKNVTKISKRELCNYRNSLCGYIFQNYHLVEYMSVIDNIKLGQTLKNKEDDIDDMLYSFGLLDKKHYKVNKLSGGEKQRVAIIRALINNPDIILADEPTGALDSKNGIKIMKILKELSKDKLVIVVSHDEKLAYEFGDRIIQIQDGIIEYSKQEDNCKFKEIKRNKIKIKNIFKLAFKNLELKKGRTIFTSFTISIGLLCMLIVVNLSKSFSEQVDELESDIVGNYPITIYNGTIPGDTEESKQFEGDIGKISSNKHENNLNKEYIDYLENSEYISYINYEYKLDMPILSDRYNMIDNFNISTIPSSKYIDNNYDIIYGKNISNMNEVLIKVDSNNRLNSDIINALKLGDYIKYSDIVGRTFKLIDYDNYYQKIDNYYFAKDNYQEMYQKSNINLQIVGIVKEKNVNFDFSGILYDYHLKEYYSNYNKSSSIIRDQINRDDSVFGYGINKADSLDKLGYTLDIDYLNIYVNNIYNKKQIISWMDDYNKNNKDNKIIYIDTIAEAINIVKDMINIITIILVIFSFIAIIISCLMIFILTNNRVVERTKEIGILKSLGARNKDILRLFNLENLLIGGYSSIIGYVFIRLLYNPINYFISNMIDGDNVFRIYNQYVFLIVIFNIFIIVLSGYIPAKMAGNKDIIDCLNERC